MKQVFFTFAILIVCLNDYPQGADTAGAERLSSIEEFEFYTRWPPSHGNTIELIGWSSVGLLAYLDREENYHNGEITINLVILDGVRDEILDRVGIDYSLFLNGGSNPFFLDRGNYPVRSFEEITVATLENWNETLERNGIRERIHNFNASLIFTPFHTFPFIQGGKTFDSWFEIVAEERDFYTNYTWSLIGSNGTQVKVISSGEATNNNPHGYVGSTVLGFYKSPYENRLAVIAAHHYRWLGSPYHNITMFGFHLDIGFN